MPLYKYIISLFVVFALLSKVGFAANIPQHKSPDASQHFVFHFRFDRAVLDSGYMDNRLSLSGLDRMLIDKSAEVDSVVIIASGSPEGVVEYNQALAARRAKAVKGYLIWKYPHINQYKIFTHSIGEDWVGLRRLVEADGNAPHKEQILKVLAQDVNPSTKEWRLKQIDGGKAWSYITNHHLRYLRAATTCVVFYKKQVVELHVEQPIEEVVVAEIEKEQVEQEQINKDTPIAIEQTIEQPIIKQRIEVVKKPLFALKTNLLFDLASILNVEVEVPIGNRWSVAGEWMFPWWRSGKSDFTMQLLSGHGEVKYWLGNRTKHEVMTGWNLGLYGGGGKHDLQLFSNDGVQGNFFDVGVSVGYAHKIYRNLRMEYSVGFGYLSTEYESYSLVRDTQYGDIKVVNYPWETRRLDWFGPTRARISLVWMLHKRKEVVR